MKAVHERALNLMPGCKPYWATLKNLTLTLYQDSTTKDQEEALDLRNAKITRKDNNLIEISISDEVTTIAFDDLEQRNDWYFLVTYISTNTTKNEKVEYRLPIEY